MTGSWHNARRRHAAESLLFDGAGRTDRGLVRSRNEDHFLLGRLDGALRVQESSVDSDFRDGAVRAPNDGRLLAIVADGMGGIRGGEHASRAAVREAALSASESVPDCDEDGDGGDVQRALNGAMLAAQQRIRDESATTFQLRDMGTTLVCGCILGGGFHVLSVGDSRAYLLRDGQLSRLTRDHTVAQRLADEGVIDEADVSRSPYHHLLWNALGGGVAEARPDFARVDLHAKDVVLLCTDGLTGPVDDESIERILAEPTSARAACDVLVDEALDRGAPDNVTCIVVMVSGT